eukprot:15120474-Ditylum_brightwellii.AAC.1
MEWVKLKNLKAPNSIQLAEDSIAKQLAGSATRSNPSIGRLPTNWGSGYQRLLTTQYRQIGRQ